MTWKLSTFKSLTNTKATTVTCSMDELVKAFTIPWNNTVTREKKQLPLWSPTVFKNGRRSGANAHSIYFIVFDMDDGLAPFSSWRLFHRYHVIAHTSFSHRPHHHKYRIILPLAHPIPADHWPQASQAAENLWNEVVGRGEPDMNALHDRARAFFRYGIPHPETPDMVAHHPMFPPGYHKTAWSIGEPLELEYEHIQVKEKPKVRYEPKVYKNGKAAMSDIMLTGQFREQMAHRMGGTVQGNEVRYITCPRCSRKSVHYSLDLHLVGATKWPTCNHINKCSWWGHFEDLI